MEIVVSKREIEIEIEKHRKEIERLINDGYDYSLDDIPSKRVFKREIERRKWKERGETIFQRLDREQQEFDDRLENTPINKMTREQLERLFKTVCKGGYFHPNVRKPQILSTIINHPNYIQKQRELTIEKILN